MTTDFVPEQAPDTQRDSLADLGDDAWATLLHLAESFHLAEPDLQLVLYTTLRTATELISTATAAGLNLYERGRFTPQAVYGVEPPALDELQKRTGEGPCIEASRSQEVVLVPDMRAEQRWPQFAELAHSLGVLSMVCVPLRVDELRLGSLSLYFAEPGEQRERDVQIARLLAAQAALAIADTQRAENLRRALQNRDVIGQAKGILMERHRLTAEQAFAVLTRVSQDRNRKLAVVAEDFVLTGDLGGADIAATEAAPH